MWDVLICTVLQRSAFRSQWLTGNSCCFPPKHMYCSSEHHCYTTNGLWTAPSGCPLAKPTLNLCYPNPAHFPTKPGLLISTNDPAILSANQTQTWMPPSTSLHGLYRFIPEANPLPHFLNELLLFLLNWSPWLSYTVRPTETSWDRIPAIYLRALWPQEKLFSRFRPHFPHL